MTTETAPCVHTQRQQETRIIEAVVYIAGMPGVFVPFYAIQARTGIPPCELGPLLDRLIAASTLRTSPIGGYSLAACPHDPAFAAMESTTCAYCGARWP